MVICLERGADLHMAQQIPLPLTVSCFSKIQLGFTFLVSAHLGSPGQRAIKRVCVCGSYYTRNELSVFCFSRTRYTYRNTFDYTHAEPKRQNFIQNKFSTCTHYEEVMIWLNRY